jgi:hypothetical protein
MRLIRLSNAIARAAACGVLLACAARAEDKPQAYEVDAGFDTAPQSLYWYSEGVVALNRDIGRSGFLLRAYSSLAEYQYTNPSVTARTVDGRQWQVDVMAGYQLVRGSATIGGYIGFDYQNVQLSPEDPTAQVRGTRTGFKVEGHFEYSDDKQPYEASLTGEYSTAFATYYAELRLGARLCDKLFVGPAVEADGDTGYDGQRLGGYAKYTFDITKSMPLEVTLVAGHQFISGSGNGGGVTGFGGGPGTYGTIELDTNF